MSIDYAIGDLHTTTSILERDTTHRWCIGMTSEQVFVNITACDHNSIMFWVAGGPVTALK